MRDDGTGTDETLAAPSVGSSPPQLAHGTTRGNDPTVDAELVPVGQVTRASSPSLSQTTIVDHDALPVVDPANYQIIRELARGGMGRILEARDLRLGRPIAIKEVLHADEGARLRFDREVRITAGLQHPAIVHVTEAGQWPTGQPFFAMKLISGKPLDQKIADAKSLSERLALLPAVTAVTDALAYAHTKSVIHRDLKPANVLVGDFGETVVIDWGIAKDLSTAREEVVSLAPHRRVEPSRTGETTGETVAGSVMGTPSYMPPEQAHGERVDARADVYALGALLYQLLAGVPPFVGRSTAEVLAKVLHDKPAALATLVPDAPADLIAVVEKAMARDPEERFPTANEMVAELKRFQQGKLVASHDYTTWELTKRWFQRNRGAVIVGAIAVTALAIVGIYSFSKILAEGRRADIQATVARAQNDANLIAEARTALETDPTAAVAILKKLSPGTGELRAARMIASEAAAAGLAHVLTAQGEIAALAFSPDGKTLVSYEQPGHVVRVWDLATLTNRPVGGKPDLLAVAVSADAVLAVDVAGQIWTWPLATTTPVSPTFVRVVGGEYRRARFSPDGKRLLLSGSHVVDSERRFSFQQFMRFVDLGGGARDLGELTDAEWAPDGRTFLAYDALKKVLIRFDGTGNEIARWADVRSRTFATDGKRVWTGGDMTSRLNLDSIHELTTPLRADIEVDVAQLVPLPDGRVAGSPAVTQMRLSAEMLRGDIKGMNNPILQDHLLTGHHWLVVSDGWTGSTDRLRGHAAAILAIAVSRDGALASGDSRGEIRLWRPPAVRRDHGDGHTTAGFAALTAERELVVTRRGPRLDVHDAAGKHTIEVTDVNPGIVRDLESVIDRNSHIGNRFVRETSKGPDDEVVELARSANGRRIATVDAGKHLVVWDVATRRGKLLGENIIHAAIDPAGDRIVTSREVENRDAREVEVWDYATGKAIQVTDQLTPTAMRFGPGGKLAIASTEGGLYLVDNGKLRRLDLPQQNYRALVFSADDMLYAGTDNWVIEAIDLRPRAPGAPGRDRTLLGHTGTVIALLLDPTETRLFSSAGDNTVRVWNLADGSSIELRKHQRVVTSLELGENNTLITASDDRTARIWDLETRASRPLVGHEDRALFAAHVAGGQRIVVVDRFHQIAEYPDNLPFDERLLRAWFDAATNLLK